MSTINPADTAYYQLALDIAKIVNPGLAFLALDELTPLLNAKGQGVDSNTTAITLRTQPCGLKWSLSVTGATLDQARAIKALCPSGYTLEVRHIEGHEYNKKGEIVRVGANTLV